MKDASVLVEEQGGVCTLTLNRPGVMNALNMELLQELQNALDAAASSESARVLVIQGAGGNFSSGADMNLLNQALPAPLWLDGLKRLGRLIATIRELPQPVVSKVCGVAVGAGANIALAGDFVIAAHDARFCEIFVNIGVIMDGGGTYFLPRLVGMARAKELALLGEMIDGRTAASMGLIHRSVSERALDREAEELCRKLSGKPPAAVALIKQGLEASLDMSLREALEWEASHQAVMLQTEEHKQRVRAFLESRLKGVKSR